MANHNLRLVDVTQDNVDSYYLERRTASRRSAIGQVTALSSVPEGKDSHKRICSLRLLDMSDSGLGAVSQSPLEKDAPITVFFPPHGNERGFDLTGYVVRCSPQQSGGHSVGIRLGRQVAAA